METATLLALTTIGSSLVQAGLGVVQGIQSSKAAALEKAQYEEEAAVARIAGEQQEVAARRNLEATLATNEAIRAGRGLSLTSGTADALRAENIRQAEDDIATIRLNTAGRVSRATYGALGAGMRETGGLFSGAGAFVSGLGTAAQGALKLKGKI